TGVNQAGWNNSTGETSLACRVELSRRRAGSRVRTDLRDFRGREVPLQHSRSWHGGAQQAGIQHLVEVLEAGEEKQLVSILVETCSRDQHGTADRAARIVILVLRPRRLGGVVQCVVGV